MVEYKHWQADWRKIKRKGRSLGCGLQFGGAKNADLLARNHAAKFKHTF
jgi:hypothetical protein